MSDREQFLALCKKAKCDAEEVPAREFVQGWRPLPAAETVVRVNGGYQCHFEAVFDKDGNILDMGQYDEM